MRRVPITRWTAAVAAATIALAPGAGAQAGGRGFSFHAPRGGIAIRGGLAAASAGGDVFGDVTDVLTLGRRDFAGGAIAGDLTIAWPGREQLEIALGTGLEASSARSEFRDYVEEGPTSSPDDDLPITQSTSFRRVPITAGLKLYLTPRGRSLGRFAWVPARLTPYVGAGGGAVWYRFRQEGDFVDFETLAVATRVFETSGWGPAAYAGGGLDLSLSPYAALTADARYRHGTARPGGDFATYDKIDLSGVSTTLGLTLRF